MSGLIERLGAAAGLAAALACASPALAGERTTLTGDWGGQRTDLAEDGIIFRGDYVSETFSVLDGGLRRGGGYTQQIRVGADFDLDKLAGWSGGILHLTFNDRRGKGVSSDVVGNRLPIQEAYGGQYTRLTELSIEQQLDGGRLDLRAGFFAMGNDLGGMAIGCNLVNAAFCAHPLSMSGDSGWYNYPNARWGVAARYAVRPDVLVRTGVYQVNPALNDKRNAWRPFASGSTGVMLPLEVEYDRGGKGGLPGHYKLGAYYDSSRVTRQGETGTVKGRYGVYLLADQMIWREGSGNRGLSLFGQFTSNPKASAPITRWYEAGLVKTGTFRGRDADTIALGVVHARLNPRLRQAYVDAAATPVDYGALPVGETAIELSYGWQATRWLTVRPDVQYVIEPGAFGYRDTPNALAVGAQVKAQF
ncbi:carbohydrate porin [Caulobacter endophyticus]|uniref:carbohydrate porin n=1 Tax=Caulobacter endophyticus TaxID=2172652 RepID=UPI00240FB913|nr:carbohydrate porin [Caulobacter endophyticus]MDG2527627.1 carbohydrate porin [Caulobacter endophyticus]